MAGSGSKLAKLGRYEIVKPLATGGMAEVLLARVAGIEGFVRHVLVKRIRTELARDERFVQMFIDEARLAAALHHQNIVQVHDIGEEAGEYFFAMEYVHGEDLRKLLMQVSRSGGKVPIEHVVTIVMAAAAGLDCAHEQRGPDRQPLGLVHRDVSPANILLGYDGSVKVADFGIAKAALRTAETRSGTLKGKVSYMSPEQCLGRTVDRRSDIYALGIVLYELVTTRRLFKGDNDFLIMSSIVQSHVPSPSLHRADLPRALETIIHRAMMPEPADRYQTAEEMRAALESFAVAAGLRTSTKALADYMLSQFGARPEPWLVEDDEPEVAITVDFDGSASGVAFPADEVLESKALPASSPIIKARERSGLERGKSNSAAETRAGSRTPVSVVDAPRRSGRAGWIALGAILVAASIAFVISTQGPSDARPVAVETAPSLPAADPAPPAPNPAPAPTEPAPAIEPPVAPAAAATVEPTPTPTQPAAATADDATSPRKRAAKRRKHGAKKDDPEVQWDPKSLFPK